MPRKVLIVDDDRILLRLTETKLKKYEHIFSVMTAENGRQAVAKLKENHISLVVTDLQMPEMDGFALLAYLSENYPDIPVIIFTAYSSPSLKKIVLEGGAAEYLEKPFVMEELAQKITASLEKESEGGILQTVPLEMFLQLIEMEQKTCTIRVKNKTSGSLGVLFFKNGELYDARIQDAKGLQSAYRIFSWDEVALSIQDTCPLQTKQIEESLQAVLMEAMRLKDEAVENNIPASPTPDESHENRAAAERSELDGFAPSDAIRGKLDKLENEKKWLKEIYQDDTWDDLTAAAAEFGKSFQAGGLKSCYLNTGESTDYIILPGNQTIVISVSPRFPHDAMIQVLSE